MRRSPQREKVDLGSYVQSFGLLARYPIIFLGPLLAAVIVHLISRLSPDDAGTIEVLGGAFGGGLGSLLKLVIYMFGYALAIVVADMAWRTGKPSFDDAWAQTRSKGGDIVFSALGLSLIVFVAWYMGGLVLGLFGGVIGFYGAMLLSLVAFGALAYAVAAASIGGVPGGLSLQASLDVAKSRPLNTVVLTIFMMLVTVGLSAILPYYIQSWLMQQTLTLPSDSIAALIGAVCDALALGILAAVIAKRYSDIAFRNM